jgi:CrcB protein
MAETHPLRTFETAALIAVGGFLGANSRHALSQLTAGLWGTFLANVLGSFLLGFVLYEALGTDLLAEETRLVFATGFLSSFTTYSTFALETVQAGSLLAALNVTGNYAFGFTGVVLGGVLASRLEAE